MLFGYDEILANAFSPKEYLEHQLNMTEEEKAARQEFFTELFEEHNRELQATP